jgi:hypothetical protein
MDNNDLSNPIILCSRREMKLNGTFKAIVAQQSEDIASKATFVTLTSSGLCK